MVLSNKKLKEKIRAKLAGSLAASEAQNHPGIEDSTEEQPPQNLQTQNHQSLKSLLDSATQKPRLSKREKRRVKIQPLEEAAEVVNTSGDADIPKEIEKGGPEGLDEGKNKKKKEKKRKRDEDGGENIEEKEAAKDLKKKKTNQKKKKKKNKKKKKGEKGEDVEIAKGGSEEQVVAETIETSISKQEDDVSTKVYVGGIPYYSSVDDIRSYFEGCGTITEVDCLTFPETGKFNGISMISFKTEAAAKRALALDGSDMGGLSLKIQPYKTTREKKISDFAPAIVEGYNRIYVGNLSWDITEDELKKLFSDCRISSIRLGKDKETGEFRGYAHVDFADSLSLSMALKLDQKVVCGRPVRIRCAVPPKVVNTNLKVMPTSKKADHFKSVPSSKKADDFTIDSTKSNEVSGDLLTSVTGKIKRRTCYDCGEKGHVSSSCPMKQAADLKNLADDSKSEPTSKKDDLTSVPTSTIGADDDMLNPVSGKIRRRTCYECGEKGHLSSACPMKQADDLKKSIDSSKSETIIKKDDDLMPVPITTTEADDMLNPVSGKIRRRTCYECGEKGHLSTSCPKRKGADLTSSSAT